MNKSCEDVGTYSNVLMNRTYNYAPLFQFFFFPNNSFRKICSIKCQTALAALKYGFIENNLLDYFNPENKTSECDYQEGRSKVFIIFLNYYFKSNFRSQFSLITGVQMKYSNALTEFMREIVCQLEY